MPDSPLRILLVADRPVDAALTQKMLVRYDVSTDGIRWAKSLVEAQEALREAEFDLSLMDWGLSASLPSKKQVLEAGADYFLNKPYKSEAVIKALHSMTKKQHAPNPDTETAGGLQ